MFTNDMVERKQDEILMQGMDPRYTFSPSQSVPVPPHSLLV